MPGISHSTPGDILWLPKRRDVGDSDPRAASHNTVPQDCFGHPVLVIGEVDSKKTVAVLILTTFRGGNKIQHRIEGRGHEPGDYVPISPAFCFVAGAPTLRLSSMKQLNKLVWVNITPHRCPKVWLQETWPRIWKGEDRGQGVEQSSLYELALYALRNGYDPVVYKKLRDTHAPPPTYTPFSFPEPVSAFIDVYESQQPVAPVISPKLFCVPRNLSAVPQPPLPPPPFQPYDHSRETEPLLPRSNSRSYSIIPCSSDKQASKYGWVKTGPVVKYLVRLFKIVAVLAVIVGVPWLAYLAITRAATALTRLIISIGKIVSGKLGEIGMGIWHGIRNGFCGLGRQLGGLFAKLGTWIKNMMRGTTRRLT
ncbi:unnamed protein product [Periconia digitata]|uniref:Uncharacterized protein n=1 Tax=Periconia digitata TaxID=1303443 RepID=A0A9W4XHI1_9PLEO|nr:unnamed protein product [Periconia digitata]